MLKNTLGIWVAAFLVSLLYFYGLDHAVMGLQGLPINLDMSPAQ